MIHTIIGYELYPLSSGGYLLRIGDYTFSTNYKDLSGKSVWYCSRRMRKRCKVSVRMSNGSILSVSGKHSHGWEEWDDLRTERIGIDIFIYNSWKSICLFGKLAMSHMKYFTPFYGYLKNYWAAETFNEFLIWFSLIFREDFKYLPIFVIRY